MQQKQTTGLIWFQNNLRVIDNTSLFHACKKHQKVMAVYVFDKHLFNKTIFDFPKINKFRAKFLIESVANLKAELALLNITLLTYFEYVEHIIPEICSDYKIDEVYIQKEWTSEELETINTVKSKLKGPTVTANFDQFLYHPEDIHLDYNNIPKIFTQFRKHVEQHAEIRKLLETPKKDLENYFETTTKIPSLTSLGFEDFVQPTFSAFPFFGGAQAAKQRIQHYFFETKKLAHYKETRNGLIGEDYSSKLSAWLANGSVSAKEIYWQVKEFESEFGANQSTYWLIFELLWRDYFKFISLKHGNAIFKTDGILKKKYHWNTHREKVQNWVDGKTNEPFVNANMLELQQTGWMSNRGRQNVASYFAKELEIDWRIGAAYFEAVLIDYDVHSNYGNWMYVAGVGNDPRDRKFNVQHQAARYDTNKKYQNLWLQTKLF